MKSRNPLASLRAAVVVLPLMAAFAVAGQSAPPKLKPGSLEPVFGLIFAMHMPEERDKVLGKPVEEQTDPTSGPWQRYKYPGTEGIIFYRNLGYWYISLPKGTTWQEAIRALGLKAENFTPKFHEKHGKSELIGKWEGTGKYAVYPESILRNLDKTITFASDGAKRADGKLVNPSGNGLPILIFDTSKFGRD